MTSASVAEETKPRPHADFHDALESTHTRTFKRQQGLYQACHLRPVSKTSSAKSLGGVVAPQAALQHISPDAESNASPPAQIQTEKTSEADEVLGGEFSSTITSTLTELLSREHERNHNAIWDAYCRLRGQEQLQFRRDVTIYLARSQGIVNTGRAIALFRQVPLEDWDNDLLNAGVSLLVRSGDLEYAVDRFKVGLDSKGLTGGLEPILLHTVSHRKWPVLIHAWMHFYASSAFQEADSEESAAFQSLESLPDIELLYFSFEHFLLTDGARSLRAFNSKKSTKLGLGALRQKLASLAIMQSPQPKQAAAILDMCGDHTLYHDYLLKAVTQWQENDLKSRAVWLADIYKSYGALPGAKPSIPLLQGMFNLFYPSNVAGLEQVYRDWHRAWGGLDQWGYEKFLKLYANAGDVQAVRGLWKRYVASYPKLLHKTRAFRSTMNVYAQVGDAAGAERELHLMKQKYGVRPDLDMWNILLKCYVRTDNYQRVVACFEEICKMYRPDSYSYAHVMTMAAKKGDLEATLAYFNQAQRDKVALSKEIAMSLVTVCCQNDRLFDAERIVTELAARGVTSTAVWNQLINFNGKQGRLRKCYELLQLMKSYNVAWDHQTHEVLLQALVRVNQVQPAYRLLRSAVREKVFPVGPEHFAIVMAGAARTGEYSLVESIATQLARAYRSTDFNTHAALVDATIQKASSPHRTREMGEKFISLLKTLRDGRAEPHSARFVAPVSGDLQYLRKQSKPIGNAIRLLVELRDFSSAEELVSLYASVIRKYKDSEPFPPEVITALMLGYLRDRKFDQVYKMWNLTLDSVLAHSRRHPAPGPGTSTSTSTSASTSTSTSSSTSSITSSSTGTGIGTGIYPAHQYDLSRPLSIVAQAFRAQRDGEGLRDTIRRVTLAGFKLTRGNWNTAVQHLAELGQWEPAMDWCERMLMPRWRGWRPPRRTLHERRLLRNTRVLQASRSAVLSLQRQWLKLRKLAAWSPLVSAKLAQVEKLYPRLHHAFVTSDYADMAHTPVERHGVGSGARKSLRKGAAELLRPFSLKELRAMEKSLTRRLKSDRRERLARKAKEKSTEGKVPQVQKQTQAQTPVHARARTSTMARADHARAKADPEPQAITTAIP